MGYIKINTSNFKTWMVEDGIQRQTAKSEPWLSRGQVNPLSFFPSSFKEVTIDIQTVMSIKWEENVNKAPTITTIHEMFWYLKPLKLVSLWVDSGS